MPKFFFEPKNIDGSRIIISGETAHHIINVLRYKIGDEVLLCDGNCVDYTAKLIQCETSKKTANAVFEVLDEKKCLTEPPIFIRLFQSAIKWENFDFAIQKSVEVGVSEIVPVVTKRSIYKLSDISKKTQRFNRIAKSAAEQSLRGFIPNVTEPLSFDEALILKESTAFFACCDEKKTLIALKENFTKTAADLWIGPEGGFTELEKKTMRTSGIIPSSLGPRVLRSETASIVAISILLC